MAWFGLQVTVLITSGHEPCQFDILFISERNNIDESGNVRKGYKNPPYSISSQGKVQQL